MNRFFQLKEAIKDLYSSIGKLHAAFKERPFTPDGRLVGDIGEAIAHLEFGVIIDRSIKKHWDGYWVNSSGSECKVQVRTTQKDSTYLKRPPEEGTFLMFKIKSDGNYDLVYNGSIMRVWDHLSQTQKSKEKMVSLDRLSKLVLDNDPFAIPVK